jgi:hypothetical protein
MLTFIEEISEECDLEMSDLEDRLCEVLDTFCEGLSTQEGMTRPPGEDDPEEADGSFMWADKAQRLIDAEIARVHAIARKYFTEEQMDEITIETHWYREF